MARALAKERAAHAGHLGKPRHVEQLSAIIARQATQAIHAAGRQHGRRRSIANLTAENERFAAEGADRHAGGHRRQSGELRDPAP